MSVTDVLYAITTGPDRRRRLLTAVGLTIFFGMIAAVVAASIGTDRALALRPLLVGASGTGIGIVILTCGATLWVWCLIVFRGRAVPASPPRELVTTGPYAWVRNPMLIGVGVTLFGLGILLHSASMVFGWTPLFMAIHVASLKFLEEPELERRLGRPYQEYRRSVPMFFPIWPKSGPEARGAGRK
jgi:protein-S-isoprenylcysteine O-methyltransferase Ste14